MKSIILILFSILIIISTFFIDISKSDSKKSESKYTLVIHGGAGAIDKNIPEYLINDYYNSLNKTLEHGKKLLEEGKTALDVVEEVVRMLEDDSLFNAGKGSVLNSEGECELDAAIMDGKTLNAGAVTGLKIVKNPVTLARKLMENTPHIFFVGEGAEEQAVKFGLEIVDPDYFKVSSRYEKWIEEKIKKDKKGTVGAVALDKYGNIAAATSTGGMSNKMKGRTGDVPVIGAGTYANNNTCGVSATGWGEKFIKNVVAFRISALIEYKNFSLQDAANEVIFNVLEKGDGGIIAVDKNGNYALIFNTISMFRGVVTSDGIFETKIWE